MGTQQRFIFGRNGFFSLGGSRAALYARSVQRPIQNKSSDVPLDA